MIINLFHLFQAMEQSDGHRQSKRWDSSTYPPFTNYNFLQTIYLYKIIDNQIKLKILILFVYIYQNQIQK